MGGAAVVVAAAFGSFALVFGDGIQAVDRHASQQCGDNENGTHCHECGLRLVAHRPTPDFLSQADWARLDGVAPAEGRKVVCHVLGRLVPFGGIFFQGLQADSLKVDRGVGLQLYGWYRIFFLHVLKRFQQGASLEWRTPCQKLVHHGAKRIDVRQVVQGFGLAFRLFGRHVAGRSHDGAGTCVAFVAVHLLGQAEVGHLGLAFFR